MKKFESIFEIVESLFSAFRYFLTEYNRKKTERIEREARENLRNSQVNNFINKNPLI